MSLSNVRKFAPSETATAVMPANVMSGRPEISIAKQFASADGKFETGLRQHSMGSWKQTQGADEFVFVLQGKFMLSDDSGRIMELAAGDAAAIPAGFTGTWAVMEPTIALYATHAG